MAVNDINLASTNINSIHSFIRRSGVYSGNTPQKGFQSFRVISYHDPKFGKRNFFSHITQFHNKPFKKSVRFGLQCIRLWTPNYLTVFYKVKRWWQYYLKSVKFITRIMNINVIIHTLSKKPLIISVSHRRHFRRQRRRWSNWKQNRLMPRCWRSTVCSNRPQ